MARNCSIIAACYLAALFSAGASLRVAAQAPGITSEKVEQLRKTILANIDKLQQKIGYDIRNIEDFSKIVETGLDKADKALFKKEMQSIILGVGGASVGRFTKGQLRIDALETALENLSKIPSIKALQYASKQTRSDASRLLKEKLSEALTDARDLDRAQQELAELDEKARNARLLEPADLGKWKLDLTGSPKASLLEGGGNFAGIELSCGPNSSLRYRAVFRQKPESSFDTYEGEGGSHYPVDAKGYLSPKDASLFVADISPLLRDYDSHHNKEQLVDLMGPGAAGGGSMNFYGFDAMRSKLRVACKSAGPSGVAALKSSGSVTVGLFSGYCLKEHFGGTNQCNCAERVLRQRFGARQYNVFDLILQKKVQEARAAYANLSMQEQFNYGMGTSMMYSSANRVCLTRLPSLQSQSLFH